MFSYEITIMLNDEQQKRLEKLVDAFKPVNGWNEKELLQFAVTSSNEYIKFLLAYLELKSDYL